MVVDKKEVPEHAIKAAERRMRKSGWRAADIEGAIVEAWPDGARCAGRVADRLIQKHRKKGNIDLFGVPRRWHWKGAR